MNKFTRTPRLTLRIHECIKRYSTAWISSSPSRSLQGTSWSTGEWPGQAIHPRFHQESARPELHGRSLNVIIRVTFTKNNLDLNVVTYFLQSLLFQCACTRCLRTAEQRISHTHPVQFQHWLCTRRSSRQVPRLQSSWASLTADRRMIRPMQTATRAMLRISPGDGARLVAQ